ncbi:MAG: hypothetical protein V3T21_03795 [Candidatus Margulisiibacteriota bacterium]
MIGGICLGSLLIASVFLGFAYIIWVMAAKETGGIKTVGQVIAILIAVLAGLILFYCTIYGGMMGQGCFGRGRGMWGPGMMRHMELLPQREQYRYMEKMMKSPQIRRWMEEYKKEYEK